ncbi:MULTISPECIES: ABC transporter permease [unclassified Pseudomonas]|uniref:ABC transporter permease n=1 Tax=unclassified Pseudomonas TaxID=196821 RepID=UPI000D3DB335|nr:MULTISPECIES: ABC transporter permease [unclassified Pseudomonas]RAU44594.1 ABC transporter permease [Pseudomonas sp. RIT 409]RAU54970.1 ABC transporter permease [Pseudomonas sp. RIT 412]
MPDALTLEPPMPANAPRDLAWRIRAARRSHTRRSIMLLLPLLTLLLVGFLTPIGGLLTRSVDNPEVATALPRTLSLLAQWDGQAVPGEAVFGAFAEDLRNARSRGQLFALNRRLGYESQALRSIPAAVLSKLPAPGEPLRERLRQAVPALDDVQTWATFKALGARYTSLYWLSAFDLKREAGQIRPVDPGKALYLEVLQRSLAIAGLVTLLCVVLGYPLAYWLARQPPRRANLLLIFVLLPFWTSLIVRTASWIVMLQSGGLVNDTLMSLHVLEKPLALVFNRTGVLISMTHILLPFLILPLYAVMKGIDPRYTNAAISLGAHPLTAFRRVYVPQTYAGVAAGALLVFIMAIGYYITPALLGGPGDQMISYFVAYYTNTTINWGMATALSSQLLIIVLLLYWVYTKVSRSAHTPA